jgi:hypothetical protein
MAQFIADLLNDFDAEFGIVSDASPLRSASPLAGTPRSPRSATPGPSPLVPPASTPRGPPAPSPLAAPAPAPEPAARHARISVAEATAIIADLRKQRVKDAEQMQRLKTENVRLAARVAVLEHTDARVTELAAKVEALLQKYLETEQVRTQQAAQLSELRQEVDILKGKLADQESGRRRSARQ